MVCLGLLRKGLADGIDQFLEKTRQQEDDDAEVLAIQQEEQHSFDGRGITINPGPVVPMSPTKTKARPLFVSESASTPRLPSSFGSSRFGTSGFGNPSHRAAGSNTSPTLSAVRTQFVRYAHRDRAGSPSTTRRPPPSPLPLEYSHPWTPEGELDQAVDVDEFEEEVVVAKSARRVEPFPVSLLFWI